MTALTKELMFVIDSQFLSSGDASNAVFQIDTTRINGFRIENFSMFNTLYTINSNNNILVLQHGLTQNAVQPGFVCDSFDSANQNGPGDLFVCPGLQQSGSNFQAANDISVNSVIVALQEPYNNSPSTVRATIYITDAGNNILSTLAQTNFEPIVNNVTGTHLYTMPSDPNFVAPGNAVTLPLASPVTILQNQFYSVSLEITGTPIITVIDPLTPGTFCMLYSTTSPQSYQIVLTDGFTSTDSLHTALQTAINTATGQNVTVSYDTATALYTISGFTIPFTYNATSSTINNAIGFTANQTGTTLISDSIANLSPVDYLCITSQALAQVSRYIIPSTPFNSIIQKISINNQPGFMMEFINYSNYIYQTDSVITLNSIDIGIVDKFFRRIPQQSRWSMILQLRQVVGTKLVQQPNLISQQQFYNNQISNQTSNSNQTLSQNTTQNQTQNTTGQTSNQGYSSFLNLELR